MKYLKTYEYENKFKFDIGEKVICVKDYWPIVDLKKGKMYKVIERKTYPFSDKNFYAVSDMENNIINSKKNNNDFSYFGETVFSKIIDYDTKKYNV